MDPVGARLAREEARQTPKKRHPATPGRSLEDTPRFPPRPDRGGDEHPI